MKAFSLILSVDRSDMNLPANVDDMIVQVLKSNKNSTVVVSSGAQCAMPWRHSAASVIHVSWPESSRKLTRLTILTGIFRW
jgi:hypothetical protein